MTDAPLLTITDAARQKILDVRAGEPDPDSLALWFEVSGVQGNSFTFDMYFRPLDEAGADDAVQPDVDPPRYGACHLRRVPRIRNLGLPTG